MSLLQCTSSYRDGSLGRQDQLVVGHRVVLSVLDLLVSIQKLQSTASLHLVVLPIPVVRLRVVVLARQALNR